MISKVDQQILKFLDDFKVARTSTIAEIYCSSIRVAQRNLLKLYRDYKLVKRTRDHFTSEYLYYRKRKPKQFEHRLLLTDFYREMSRLYNVEKFINEVSIEHLRSDAIMAYKKENQANYDVAFVEVERSHKKLDIEKYLKLYYGELYKKYGFNSFPKLYAITNQKIPKIEEFEIIQVKEDLSNLG